MVNYPVPSVKKSHFRPTTSKDYKQSLNSQKLQMNPFKSYKLAPKFQDFKVTEQGFGKSFC